MASIASKTFVISLSDVSEDAPRATRRIYIHADVLKAAKLSTGDVVAIHAENCPGRNKAYSVGIVWPSLERSQDAISVASSLLLTARLSEGSKVKVCPLAGKSPPGLPSLRQIQDAGIVRVKEITATEHASPSSAPKPTKKGRDWLLLLVREALVDLKYLSPTQTLDIVYEGRSRRFAVASVSLRRSAANHSSEDLSTTFQALSLDLPPQLWAVGWDTSVFIEEDKIRKKDDGTPHKPEIEALAHTSLNDAYTSVGGLHKQIQQIRDLLEIPLTRPELFRHFGLKPPRGILLHGPPGTGKTHLARAIASSTSSSILVVNGPELSSAYHGETESKLRAVFQEARSKSPCIVVLDEVDALCPKREDGGQGGEVEKRVVATLLTIMDGMVDEDLDEGGGRVVVVATTNRPNAIDPALRRPGRFDREIEIGVPDAEARYSILNVLLSKTPHTLSDIDIRSVASQAHGYVGADLAAVVREAGTTAIKRYLPTITLDSSAPPTLPNLLPSDLQLALPTIRPSALRSLYLSTTPISFSSIGGLSSTIAKLRETVEWPLKHPEVFERLGVRPVKGVLLYGPPGCAKTVLVRALAGESGVNFVAVKGPELLSKFVGESERAVREIFAKARAASPAIIFFDEIDAIATSRSSSDVSSSPHEGVLTSLLNEMDGVQELVGVTVVAATNRPDVIDSALMRPGRLDRLLYVGPPDQKGREEILRIRMAKMSVEEGINVDEIAAMTEGCSGAEITALCQEAALLTMRLNMNASFVSQKAFVAAARAIKRQITPEVVERFRSWSKNSGLTDV